MKWEVAEQNDSSSPKPSNTGAQIFSPEKGNGMKAWKGI